MKLKKEAIIPKSVGKTCSFKNVRYNVHSGFWNGQKHHNGKRIFTQARTALDAARLLNEKCRNAGSDLPNPDLETEAKKRRLAPKLERLRVGKKPHKFKNLCYNKRTGFWIGQKRYKGTRLASQGRTPLDAAKLLNKRCREAGAEPPNPEIDRRIIWESIQLEMNQNEAQAEIIAMSEAFLDKWQCQLQEKNLEDIFQNLNRHVSKLLQKAK